MGKTRRPFGIWSLPWVFLVSSFGLAAAREGVGVELFPGAESQPRVARAVEAYYRPHITGLQALSATVLVTPADFGSVSGFYAPRMDSGKWGWRKKTYSVLHQIQTLKFMRSELAKRERTPGTTIPVVFQPLFGDTSWSPTQFSSRLDALVVQHKEAKIEIAEGTRTFDRDSGSQVRVTIERPFIDVEAMTLVAKTRIVLVTVARREESREP
jgi:hypothetical protein